MGLLTALKGVLGSGSKPLGLLDIKKRFRVDTRKAVGSVSEFRIVEDLETKQRFGLKLLDAKKTEQFRNRFKGLKLPSEGEISSSVEHPNVCKTIEFGKTTDGQEYLLLELLEGRRLDTVISRDLIKKQTDKYKIISHMGSAIQAVHDAGFIHRDVCPRNFIFDKAHKHLKLIDFGLSVPNKDEFRQPRNRTGTPLYMAPEIVRRRATCPKVDVFAFGVSVFELLTGQHPWGTVENTSKSALLFDSRPPTDIKELAPELPDKLAKAVHQCLLVNPEKRMNSCKSFLAVTGITGS